MTAKSLLNMLDQGVAMMQQISLLVCSLSPACIALRFCREVCLVVLAM